MTLRTAGVLTFTAAAAAAFVGATPAAAAPDCGAVPVGATLTVLGGTTCQLEFATDGSYSWTTPVTVQGLQALLLGGGGGAVIDPPNVGYAGSAGELRYVDLSSTQGSAPVTIVVGDGGPSGDSIGPAEFGEDTSVTVPAGTSVADGGTSGGFSGDCLPEGSLSLDAGNGDGAGGDVGTTNICETDYAPGLTPSIDTVDSYGTPRLAGFADITTEFGIGGRVLITGDVLPADASLDGLGIGAHVRYDGGVDEIIEANADGGSGRVILRYTIGAALPVTGVETGLGLGIAAGLALVGATLMLVSRRRTQA